MKKKMFIFTLIVAVLAGTMIWSNAVLAARPIELSLNLFIHAQHSRFVHCHKPWIDMIEKRTNGRVKITPYFSNALTPMPEKFDSTVSGIADISEGLTFVTSGRFPMTDLLMLPELGLRTAQSTGRALWHLYETFPELQKEYKGVKMLFVHASPALMVCSRKKPIQTLDDLKGLKIWASGGVNVLSLKAIGASPVALAPGEVYLALDKGVLDGANSDFEIFSSRRFYEVAKYMVTNISLSHALFYMIMNEQTWNRLPPDIQKVFEELTGEWAVDFYDKIRDREEEHSEKVAKEKGTIFLELPAQDTAKVRRLLEPVKEKYVSDLEAKGLPARAAFQEILKFAD